MRTVGATLVALLIVGCSPTPPPAAPANTARNLLLITIDTLRADRVGAYGYAPARTRNLDALARDGVRFDRAFATAPITLTSHASLLTGLYPPGHGARHNGMRLQPGTLTLATLLRNQGFATAAFVAAFPLDRRFGLDAGFDAYSDRLPRDGRGRALNERPGHVVADEAIAWLAAHRGRPFFLWAHFFEPHAPYGDPTLGPARPAQSRYDEEVSIADRDAGRVIDAAREGREDTLVIVAGDHGEAFGEHGEIGHSLFVYDTTLRVPLIIQGPGVPAGRAVRGPVTLVDVAPTVMRLLHLRPLDGDGIDLRPAMDGSPLPDREIYAESFAPLLDFGWSSLRTVRTGPWKAIAAPRAELYDVEADPGEVADLAGSTAAARPTLPAPKEAASRERLRVLLERIARYGPAELPAGSPSADPETAARLAALGYLQRSAAATATRPDPKDRRGLAARIARVTSGEAQGPSLLPLLEAIVREDPANGQMQLRLGDALVAAGRLSEAEAPFRAAIAARLPSADPYIGLALCQSQRGDLRAARATLLAGDRTEPGNAVVHANLGLLDARGPNAAAAIPALRRALDLDPDFHEARFNLALVLARQGRREEALREAQELLWRLPVQATQRAEVERLAATLR